MLHKSLSRLVVSFCLVSLLTLSACSSSQTPSRFEQTQEESISTGNKNNAVSEEAVKGATLNDFFPSSSDEYERVFTQEKDGFVQASLKFKGEKIATLAIFDTTSNPTAKKSFANSTEDVEGFPLVQKGSSNTAVLVGDRYQVSVRASNPDFDVEKRKEWLSKFELQKLANLK